MNRKNKQQQHKQQREPKENVKQLNLACTCIIYICTIEIGRRMTRLDGGRIKSRLYDLAECDIPCDFHVITIKASKMNKRKQQQQYQHIKTRRRNEPISKHSD